ncbi:hypothetical protein GALMADRAFT_144077 [Galerina marginata CBS 339.88]|uniref:Uncharacterized protein n=1 Tax=Galerina marginata (strain CBS 339.88) TaxID=685588 RepID=A0A067SLW5_GALM3|nr:hypothetical protein GALMADRAFT_144077 [Galerina marginata CBS 339.88]
MPGMTRSFKRTLWRKLSSDPLFPRKSKGAKYQNRPTWCGSSSTASCILTRWSVGLEGRISFPPRIVSIALLVVLPLPNLNIGAANAFSLTSFVWDAA